MSKKYLVLLVIGLFVISGCSDWNLFQWMRKESVETKSVAELVVDGQVALSKGNYAAAKKYFEDALKKDADNSEALYGLAQANLKEAGLDIAEIATTFLEGAGEEEIISPETNDLVNACADAGTYLKVIAESAGEGEIIPPEIDINDLVDACAAAETYLKVIAKGHGDGKIPADNVDVNLNLALCIILNTVGELIDTNNNGENDPADLVYINENWEVTIYDGELTPSQEEDLKEDLRWAIGRVEEAIDFVIVALNSAELSSDSTMGKIRDELVNNLLPELEAALDELEV